MSTITKDQAQKIFEAADEVIAALAGTNEDVHPESDNMLRLWDDLNDRYAPPEVVRELALIALASLEAEKNAEPVAKVETVGVCWYADNGMPRKPAVGTELYAAPPAPVSVPDESAVELLANDLMKRIDKITGERHSVATLSSLRVSIVEACRAAMLQGAEIAESPTTMQAAPTLDSSPKIAESPSSNSPVIPDGWVMVPKELTCEMDDAAWEAYHETRSMSDIWAALLAAAPQQEVK